MPGASPAAASGLLEGALAQDLDDRPRLHLQLDTAGDLGVSLSISAEDAVWEAALEGEPDPWFDTKKAAVDARQFIPIKAIEVTGSIA